MQSKERSINKILNAQFRDRLGYVGLARLLCFRSSDKTSGLI